MTVQRKVPHCSSAHPENKLNKVRIILLKNAGCNEGNEKCLAIEMNMLSGTVNGHGDMENISNYSPKFEYQLVFTNQKSARVVGLEESIAVSQSGCQGLVGLAVRQSGPNKPASWSAGQCPLWGCITF